MFGGRGQAREEERAEPPALVRVGRAQTDLGPVAAEAEVLRAADDRTVVPAVQREHREVFVAVARHHAPRDLTHVDRRAAEAQATGLVGQTDQVVLDTTQVVGMREAYADGRPVAKGHVLRDIARVHARSHHPANPFPMPPQYDCTIGRPARYDRVVPGAIENLRISRRRTGIEPAWELAPPLRC